MCFGGQVLIFLFRILYIMPVSRIPPNYFCYSDIAIQVYPPLCCLVFGLLFVKTDQNQILDMCG